MDASTRHRLIAEWLAGGLAPEGVSALAAAARSDGALRRDLAVFTQVERLLRHRGAIGAARDAFAEEVVARLGASGGDGGEFCSGVIARIGGEALEARPHPRSLAWMGRWGSWAAAFVVIFGCVGLFAWRGASGTVLARVEGLEAVRWAEGQRPLLEGDGIGRGTIRLDGGFLKLRMASGASVILDGPALLDVLGRNRVRLGSGRVAAEVPSAATGFRIDSPDGRIIDVGTRFGVEVGPRGRGTEVHVLDGLVRASVPGEAAARELRESQALRIEARSATAIPADDTRFLTRLPPRSASPAAYAHWPFDEGDGPTTRAAGALATATAARLESLAGDGGGPSWVAGRFGSALAFDGAGDFVATDFGGIPGGRARTVALWAKVPADWEPSNGFALVSWGTMRPGAAWQISINPLADDGPIGRLRVGVHTSQVIGTRDLRDGRWHHLAAVLFDGAGPRDTTHILLFVDGELETAARKGIREVQTDTGRPGATAVALGRNMDPHPHRGGRVFRGALDEVFIFDAALPHEAIGRLMRENLPPGHTPKDTSP